MPLITVDSGYGKLNKTQPKKTAEKCVVRNDEMQFSTLVMF